MTFMYVCITFQIGETPALYMYAGICIHILGHSPDHMWN